MYDGVNKARFFEYIPFFIEVEDFRSTFSLTGEDRFARVLKQLEAATQKAIEREFWDGHVARTDSTPNSYLTKTGLVTVLGTSDPLTTQKGLTLLEEALSNSPTGTEGLLHLTRGVATSLGTSWLLMRVEDSKGKFHIETVNGTNAVVGSGYSGNGPVIQMASRSTGSNIGTVVTQTPHYLKAGEQVAIDIPGVTSVFEPQATVVTVLSPTSFTVSLPGVATVGSTATVGTVQMLATSTTKWIYATGSVDVYVGKSEVVNETLAQGYDVATNQNNMRIKAQRPAAAYFDPEVHYAVKVDLTA
jgi:hypothetical protein